MEKLLQDLGYAVRIISKRPGVTLTIILSLALGIGANVVIFTLVNAVLFRTAPVAEPDPDPPRAPVRPPVARRDVKVGT